MSNFIYTPTTPALSTALAPPVNVQTNAKLASSLAALAARKQIPVPTDPEECKKKLRERGLPVTLFAEGHWERRERLAKILVEESQNGNESDVSVESDASPANEEFYTAGWAGLKEERVKIAQYSLKRSRERTEVQKKTLQVNPSHIKASRKLLYNSLKTNGLAATQVGGTRPVATCCFHPSSYQLATGCWDGTIKLWDVPSCKQVADLVGHQDKVTSVEWDKTGQLLISAGGDGVIYGWSAEGNRISEYKGHQIRCNRLGWHPSGNYFGSTSMDTTWRLWDARTTQEILVQEGHAADVHDIDFQCDGSLAVTGSKDTFARVWDLRTGRSIAPLEGHTDSVLSVSWSPNGFVVATGGADNTIRIHDVRHLKTNLAKIPAHGSNVSSVKFHRPTGDKMLLASGPHQEELDEVEHGRIYRGDFMVSSGYDGTVRYWGSGDWKCIKTLNVGNEGEKIMEVDVTDDVKWTASVSYDRTYKLWTNETALGEDLSGQ